MNRSLSYSRSNRHPTPSGHQHAPDPLCALIGLNVNDVPHLTEDRVGRAAWYGDPARGLQPDRWHVRCVDATQTNVENGVFAE
jgi:hypothetical protein